MDVSDLIWELVLDAETAQLLGEVNAELERLTQEPSSRRRRAEMVRAEAKLARWMEP